MGPVVVELLVVGAVPESAVDGPEPVVVVVSPVVPVPVALSPNSYGRSVQAASASERGMHRREPDISPKLVPDLTEKERA